MITSKLFDTYNGREVYAYTLSDEISVTICTLGATILSITVPDKDGNAVDVALGMTTAQDVAEKGDYMGSVVGRCGNRIANGEFTLNGVKYKLARNDGNAHLHGGNFGFNRKIYDAQVLGDSLLLLASAADGEEGYPANLYFGVKYSVKGKNLCIDYYGTADNDTVFNPTNHVYFNLNGESDGSILDNAVQIYADEYLQVDADLIPTEKASVDGTPFDFRSPKPIGRDIDADDGQLSVAGGYDHNFCVNGGRIATAYSPKTGISMDVFTDRVGVQFYTGNFLKGQKGKSVYGRRSGFCFETQMYPNAVNRPDFVSPVIRKWAKTHSQTTYSFSVIQD
ncbi:MAG: galactose mutarotase [Corallococcus sp.]|nr:galactose mutarotase [Corallococcus sp.]